MPGPKERLSRSSVALISRRHDGEMRWLTRWNRPWSSLAFVGGHKEGAETYQQCILREIQEELGLVDGLDFTLVAEPRAVLEFDAFSERAQVETGYVMTLYDVLLLDTPETAALDRDPDVRWVTEAEIRARRNAEGLPISPTLARILAVVSPGRSSSQS